MKKICDLNIQIGKKTFKVPVWGKIFKTSRTHEPRGVIFFCIREHQFCGISKSIDTHDVITVIADRVHFQHRAMVGKKLKRIRGRLVTIGHSIDEVTHKFFVVGQLDDIDTITIPFFIKDMRKWEAEAYTSERIKRAHELIKVSFSEPKIKFSDIVEYETARKV